MQLELEGEALVKNLNVRREYHGEDRELGADLKLQFKLDLDVLAQLAPTLKTLLYANADDPLQRSLRIPDLKPLQFDITYEEHMLHLAERSFSGVTVSKLSVDAQADGGVELTLTASFSRIKSDWIAELALAFVDEVASVRIEPAQGALFSEAA